MSMYVLLYYCHLGVTETNEPCSNYINYNIIIIAIIASAIVVRNLVHSLLLVCTINVNKPIRVHEQSGIIDNISLYSQCEQTHTRA